MITPGVTHSQMEAGVKMAGSVPLIARSDSPNERLCKVCEAPASGKYFGALVCLPCKTFFIRCTSEDMDVSTMRCRGTFNCDVSASNRASCKFCRYRRCLAVGMSRKERPECVAAQEGQQLCAVCGDIANGIHFGAVTCEGCKKFFRRGQKEFETYVCKTDRKCTINPRTRNVCRYCRYQKCVRAGMSRQGIRMGRPSKTQKLLMASKPPTSEATSQEKLPHPHQEEWLSKADVKIEMQVGPNLPLNCRESDGSWAAKRKRYSVDSFPFSTAQLTMPALQAPFAKSNPFVPFPQYPFQIATANAHETVYPSPEQARAFVEWQQHHHHHHHHHHHQQHQQKQLPINRPILHTRDNVRYPEADIQMENRMTYDPQKTGCCRRNSDSDSGVSIPDDYSSSAASDTDRSLSPEAEELAHTASLETDKCTHEVLDHIEHLKTIHSLFLTKFNASNALIEAKFNLAIYNLSRERKVTQEDAEQTCMQFLQEMLVMFTETEFNYLEGLLVGRSMNKDDKYTMLKYAGPVCRIAVMCLNCYRADSEELRNMSYWKTSPGKHDYEFKKYILKVSKEIDELQLDADEQSLMVALTTLSLDLQLKDHGPITATRRKVVDCLTYYLSKKRRSEEKIERLLSLVIPSVRHLAKMYQEIMNSFPMLTTGSKDTPDSEKCN